MALFNKNNLTTIPDVTAAQAQDIYDYAKTNEMDIQGSTSTVYTAKGDVEMKRCAQTAKEVDSIQNQCIAELSKETKPATQADLVALVSSDILDVETVVNDIRRFRNNDPDAEPTYDQWKAMFQQDPLV